MIFPLPHRIHLSQPIFKADKKDFTSTLVSWAWHSIPQIFYHVCHPKEIYIVTNAGPGETFHLDLVNSKTRWVILAMTNVLITVILPNSVIFLLDETFNSFSISLSLFFIVDQHSFMYIGRKYHTQHFKCCRVLIQIQFQHKFYMRVFSWTYPHNHSFLKLHV